MTTDQQQDPLVTWCYLYLDELQLHLHNDNKDDEDNDDNDLYHPHLL